MTAAQNSDYKDAIKQSKSVLAIDPENEVAKNILLASQAAEKD